MTQAEKIANVQGRVNDSACTDAIAAMFLDDAEEAIFLRMYPFGVPAEAVTVPKRYERLQCRIAAICFLMVGAEGEQIHIENGTHRHYSTTYCGDLLQEVMQVIRLR